MSFYRSNLNLFNKLDFLHFLLKRVTQLDIFYNSKYNTGSKLFYDLNNLDKQSFDKYMSESILAAFGKQGDYSRLKQVIDSSLFK